jgi:hypothetical protein
MLDPHLIFIPLGKGESKGHLQNQVYATIRGFEQVICETASTREKYCIGKFCLYDGFFMCAPSLFAFSRMCVRFANTGFLVPLFMTWTRFDIKR